MLPKAQAEEKINKILLEFSDAERRAEVIEVYKIDNWMIRLFYQYYMILIISLSSVKMVGTKKQSNSNKVIRKELRSFPFLIDLLHYR